MKLRQIASLIALATVVPYAVAAPQGATKPSAKAKTQVKAVAHKITAKQAAKIALAKYKGTLKGTPKLEHEDGAWQYEVLIKVGKTLKEVNVNADSGKITSVENTSAKEEAKEKKADAKKKG